MKSDKPVSQRSRTASDIGRSEENTESSDRSQTRRVTAVACLGCQRRKGKCDGRRPSCSACRGRGAICVFETADGLTRSADLKQKNQMLVSRMLELEQVLDRLRSEDDVQSSNTLARLRLGDGLQEILRDGEPLSATTEHSMSGTKRSRTWTSISAERSRRSSDADVAASAMMTSSPSPSMTDASKTYSVKPRMPRVQDTWLLPFWDEASPSFQQPYPSEQGVSPPEGQSRGDGRTQFQPPQASPTYAHMQPPPREEPGSSRSQFAEEHEARTMPSIRSYAMRSEGNSIDICTGFLDSEQNRQDSLRGMDSMSPQWSSGQKGATLSVPSWAILPKHRPAEDSINLAYMSFLQEKRYMVQNGSAVQPPFGAHPVIDVLFNERVFATADDVSKWAGRLAASYFGPSIEQIVCFWTAWYIMRWMIAPSPETYEAMPEWLRPIPQQLFVPHNISNDFLTWPRLREAVMRREDMQRNSEWLLELGRTLSCNWSRSMEEALYRDGETGIIALNPAAIEHLGDLSNWSVGPRFRAWMPNVDQYVRIKYDVDE